MNRDPNQLDKIGQQQNIYFIVESFLRFRLNMITVYNVAMFLESINWFITRVLLWRGKTLQSSLVVGYITAHSEISKL